MQQKQEVFGKDFRLLCIQAAVVSFNVAAIAAMIPSIAVSFRQTPLFMGKLTWLYMLPYGLGALLWGPLSHKFRADHLLRQIFFLYALSCCGVVFSRTVVQIFFCTFCMGLSSSGITPLSLIIIGHSAAPQKGRQVGTYFSGTFIASLCGLLLSGFMDWRYIYLIPGVLGSLFSLITWRSMSPFDFRKESYRFSYHVTLRDPMVGTLFLLIFLSSTFYHSIQQWLGVYLKTSYPLSQLAISMFFSVSLAWAFCTEYFGGFLSDRRGRVRVFSWGTYGMLLFVASLFILKARAVWQLFVVVACWGGGWGLAHVGLSSYLTHLPDKYLRDASSLNSAVRFISGGIGAWCGGAMITAFGFQAHFLIISVLLVLLAWYSPKALKER